MAWKLATIVVALGGLGVATPAAAATTLTEGPNTVSTPRFALDFDDGAGNVERLTTLRWRDSAGTLGPDLANEGGNGSGLCSGFTEFWGQSYATQDFAPPGPVVAGTTGTWIANGTRTVEIIGSAPTACSGADPVVPVRTRYSFFDDGERASTIRFERRWAFPSGSPAYGPINLRAFVPRLPVSTYDQVVYPATDGRLVTTTTSGPRLSADWAGTWVALNSATTNAGMVILRDPANTEPARIVFDNDSFSASNNSGVSLDKPTGGWQAPITETEYLCFYDATSWPVASRSAMSPPPGCRPRVVPVNVELPTVTGPAGNPNPGSVLTASPGTWEHAVGDFAFQWSRCAGGTCTEIGDATGQSYTATADDVGTSLTVTVTATSPDGERDTAASSLVGSVRGTVYEGSTATPLAGARVQACRIPDGGCRTAITDARGRYRIQAARSGDHELKAFPSAASAALPDTDQVRIEDEAEATAPDLVLQVPAPPPPGVSVGGPGSRGTAPGGVPVVHWDVPFRVRVYVSGPSEVEATLEMPGGEEEEPVEEDFEEDEESEDEDDGNWEFEFPATNPLHGNGFIRITIRPPTEEDPDGEIIFPVYIDPSGHVRTTGGAALADATVTLLRSDLPGGPFTVVPDGSEVMSPSNRANPDRSDATGHFGWDVVAGYYKVRVGKAGCHAPGSPGQASVETPVMEIPPPVTNLDIRLHCPAPAAPGGDTPTGGSGPSGATVGDGPPAATPGGGAPSSVEPLRPASTLLATLAVRRNAGTVLVGRTGAFTLPGTRAGCPAGAPGPCLLVVAVRVPAATVRPRAARQRRALRLGTHRLSVPAGRTRAVRGKLSRRGRALLRRRGRVRATVSIRATVPAGGSVARTVRATLERRGRAPVGGRRR